MAGLLQDLKLLKNKIIQKIVRKFAHSEDLISKIELFYCEKKIVFILGLVFCAIGCHRNCNSNIAHYAISFVGCLVLF